ncbi:hypothetical protein ACHAXT_003079 [Thalassiosira profunda]
MLHTGRAVTPGTESGSRKGLKMGWKIYPLLTLLLLATLQLRWTALFDYFGKLAADEGAKPTQPLRARPPEAPREVSISDRLRPFCQRWSEEDAHNRTLQPFDIWFTQHPSWVVTNETEDRFCVQRDDSDHLRRGILQIYANQFLSSCKRVHIRYMWSSGWGADFSNMQGGLVTALRGGIPFVAEVVEDPWHYTANKDDHSNLTCAAGDTTCYFLPYHGCPSYKELREATDIEIIDDESQDPEFSDLVDVSEELGSEAYLFMTRKQLWLRRAVFDYKQQFRSKSGIGPDLTDCTVMHVRRSDVVLHGDQSRKYFPVADYVRLIPEERLKDPNHYIFLLTDDQNAIDEAHEFFPELKWKYFDRPRHKGSEGGWENQTPSRNPALEVTTLLATFDLVQECSAMVHGASSFAELVHQHMLFSKKHNRIERYRVDKGRIHAEKHEGSEEDLQKSLERMRQMNGTVLDVTRSEEKSGDVVNAKLVSATKKKGAARREKRREKRAKKLPANQTHCSDSDDRGGLIVVNILGLLANDLFEVAMAKRIATQLCGWHVIYRSAWNSAFPTPETDRCFPNALADSNNRQERSGGYRTMEAILRIMKSEDGNDAKKINLTALSRALTYNSLEPEKHEGWDMDEDKANAMVEKWVDFLGERAVKIEHGEYDFKGDNIDQLVSRLQDASSKVQVLSLGAFFIHYDWMRDWMDEISEWLHIDPSCCTTSIESIKETIVIHIRDFEPEDDGKNKNLQVGVYRDIIEKYATSSKDERQVVVVCQPKSINTTIVQDLVQEFGAVVRPGENNIDGWCILRSARGMIIPSTSSSFSELAALLAGHENDNVQVHYPTHTLRNPMVTLKIPSWKYHLTNRNNTGVAVFDVDHERLKVDQA